ncbi:hypothetical protein B296_00020812 [Ensete ventricosum]|uniref:Uncharacterized protein n=1 Tax=Ensete ventricosum TaxID=4639 RepID=A0A426ZM15_ENSVE|nr:hypothetical protein B296_00020812 [Ensete ventricosum]
MDVVAGGVSTMQFDLYARDQLSEIRSSGKSKEVVGSAISWPRSRQVVALVSRRPAKGPCLGVSVRPDPSND